MEVSFVESMRGAVKTDAGEDCPVEFDVVAKAPHLHRFLLDGHTELRGLLRAPKWVDETPAKGSLTISPLALVYRVEFEGRDGQTLVLEGKKHPSHFKPLSSMTTMEVALRSGSTVLARGEMKFDLRELPPFLLSWLPVGRWAQRALDVRRRRVEREHLEGRPHS
jgi:hypothetical protein